MALAAARLFFCDGRTVTKPWPRYNACHLARRCQNLRFPLVRPHPPTPSALHAFDQQLCGYVRDNVQEAMEDPKCAKHFSNLDAKLLAYLQNQATTDETQPLLLNENELTLLEDFAATVPAKGPYIIHWLPYPALHGRYRESVPEIEKRLGARAAKRWAEYSTGVARDLERPDLELHDGIEHVRRWLSEIRSLLRIVGRRGSAAGCFRWVSHADVPKSVLAPCYRRF